jgi:hypothetical protein
LIKWMLRGGRAYLLLAAGVALIRIVLLAFGGH